LTEIQQSRYDQLLRRVCDLKGPGSKVNDALTELFPMIDVENVPGELLMLAGTRICMGGGTLAGVAAQAITAQLFNPVDSGKLITVTRVYAAWLGSTTVRWGTTVVSLATPIGTERFRDTRLIVPAAPSGEIHQLSRVPLATGINQARLANNDTFELNDPNGVAVLAPGTGFEIGNATLDLDIHYGFNWRERVAEPSELNL